MEVDIKVDFVYFLYRTFNLLCFAYKSRWKSYILIYRGNGRGIKYLKWTLSTVNEI